MVYGILGLIDPYEAALITVDYKMDSWKVFAQTTYAAIRGNTSFHVLDMVDLRAGRDDGDEEQINTPVQVWREIHGDTSKLLPSWSIDFRCFPKGGGWKLGGWRGVHLARRREQLDRRCRLSADCGSLRIKALPFDRIAVHTPVRTTPYEPGIDEDDIIYDFLFSVISPTLVGALRNRELGDAVEVDEHRGVMLLAAPLLTTQVKAEEVLGLLADTETFSRRCHVFGSIARLSAANLVMSSTNDEGQTTVARYRITNDRIVEPSYDPTANAIKTAALLWASLCNTPAEVQRSGRVQVDTGLAESFLEPCRLLRENAAATGVGLAFFGTQAAGMVGIAPRGVGAGDLIVRAPDEESFLVLRPQVRRLQDDNGDDGGGEVVWQFMGRALVFSLHTPDSWEERDELCKIGSFNKAPDFVLC